MALPSWPDDTPEHKKLKAHYAHLAKDKKNIVLAASGLVALADAGGGDAGPGAGAPGAGLPGQTISEAAAGAAGPAGAGKTVKGGHAPKKIASALGEEKFHGNIGDFIIPHGKEHWVAGQPGHMVHSITPELWKANQWKPGDAKQAVEQGTHHYVQAGNHTYAVHNGLEVHVPKDVDTGDEAQVKNAPKIVVKKGPNPEHVVLHPGDDDMPGKPVPTSAMAIGNLAAHYKKLPEPEPKKAVTIGGKHAAWVPHHWQVHKSSTAPEDKLTGKFAKDPDTGDWHYVGKTGKVEKINPPTAANLEKWAAKGQLVKEDHETHEPAPSHVAPTTPKPEPPPAPPEPAKVTPMVKVAAKPAPAESTGAEAVKVDIGGIPVTKEEIHHAISVLNSKLSTNVKGPLKNAGNPLADMDYMAVSKAELAKYPGLLVPKGTKAKHVGQVKLAILHHLAGKLDELSATEAEQHVTEETTAKAEAAAEHAQDLTPHTYSWGGKTATKEQLQEAADWLQQTMGGKQSFSQAMKKTGNPLATADYMGEAKKYKTAHPDTAKSWSTKLLMLESLKEHAGELAKADQETGHDQSAELHALAGQKVSALKPGWANNPHGAVAAALLYAHHNKVNTYAFASHATPGTWEVDFSPPAKGYSWFTASPEHKVTMTIGGEQKDYAADMTLADAKSWIKPPPEAVPEPEKPPVAPPKEEVKPYPAEAKPPPKLKVNVVEPVKINWPKPEAEAPKPEPLPEPEVKVPPAPPPAAEMFPDDWKAAAPDWKDINQLILLATSKDVPGVAGDVDNALASALWGSAKLNATRYILAKEGGGWKFSKTPGLTGAWGAPGELYYRITPDHQVILVGKDGSETAFSSGMVLKLAQLLKKEEPKPAPEPPKPAPEPPKPAPEPEAKAEPEAMQDVMVKGKTVAQVPKSAVIYHGTGAYPESANFKYVKLKDGTWQKYGSLGTYGEPSAGKYDQWVTGGQLVPEKIEKAAPKPAEPPKPEKVWLPGIGKDIYIGEPGDSTWQDTQEPGYGTYIKHEDGTWSLQYAGGGVHILGTNAALDNWIGNGLLKPLSASAKLLAETSGAPEHAPEPDVEPHLAPKAEPATKPLTIKGKGVGSIPADATVYWHAATAKTQDDAAAYYVKYGDGSWGIFVQGQQGDQGTSEPQKLDALAAGGALVEYGKEKPADVVTEIPAILDNKILGMVPAGSKFYSGPKPEYGYTPYYVKQPDGSWLESSYGNNLSKSYYGGDKQLAAGTIHEIPAPTEQEIAEAKAIAEVKTWAHTAAISKADADKSWKGQVAEKLSGKSHYASQAQYIFQYAGGGGWGSAGYTPHNASEYWHFNPESLKVQHHFKPSPQYPEGLTEDIPVSEIIDHVKQALTPGAVTVDGKVYKFGFYYSPKGKAFLEVKEAKNYGKYHKHKYGKPGGTAAFIWHDTSGNTAAKTPSFAASQLQKNTEYWETEKPLVPKAFFANKYATTAAPGSYKLWSDAHGMNGSEHITVHEDGSALWQDPSTGEHGTLFGTTSSMEGGMVLDKYGNTVVEPGTMPSVYHLFGGQGMTYMEVEGLRNKLQQTGGYKWAPVFWAGIGVPQDEAMNRVLAFVEDKGLSGNGEDQYHALMGLMNELLSIPQQQAGAKAEAPAEVKFLKGLPPGIYGPKDIFSFAGQGYAKPFDGSLANDVLAAMGSPQLASVIEAVSEQYGGGKVVGTHKSGLTKPERLAWLHAWKKGDMQTVFNLDAKGGKVSPAHPGAPENTVTHHMTWAPWDSGQIPASQTIEGNWSDPGITPLKDEVDNYLIKVNVQHAAYLSAKERRLLVKLHRNGDQEAVDELSRTAAERYQGKEQPLTAPPVWHDTLTPAKSYSVFLEDATPAKSWTNEATQDFVNHNEAALAPFAQQLISDQGSSLTPAEWLHQSGYYAKPAVQAYLDDVVAKAKEEELRPKWELVDGKPGYVRDQNGNTKLWFSGTKPEMASRIAVNSLARAFGFKTPKAEWAKLEKDGTPGILTDEVVPKGSLAHVAGGLTSLTDKQLADIAREHVLDYLLGNPSSTAGSYLVMHDGSVVSAGKPGAFTGLKWQGASLDHLDEQFKQPVSLLFDSMASGGVSKASADEAYIGAVRVAQRMCKLPDARFSQLLGGTGLSTAGVAALVARKNSLVNDITALWDSAYAKLGWTPPEVPVTALEGGAHSGFSEVDGMEHVASAKSAGVAFFFDEPGLARGAVHVWQEINPSGKPATRGEFELRGKSLSDLLAWVKSHSGEAAKLAPKDEYEFHQAILTAAEAVSTHSLTPENPYGKKFVLYGPISDAALLAMNEVKDKLEQRLHESEAALEAGASSAKYLAALDKYGDPHAVVEMAKFYLDQIQKVNLAKVQDTIPEVGDFPAFELKGKVSEAAGGIQVAGPKTATRQLGTNSANLTADSWQLDPKTGELVLKAGLLTHYAGSVYEVKLPTGEVIEISDPANSPKAQQGRVRFLAVHDQGSSSLENVRGFLQEAGLPMKEATQGAMENLYWRLAAADMGDRADRQNPAQKKMWGALAKGSGIPLSQIHGPVRGMIDKLAALGLPAEDEAKIWREAMAHMASPEKVKAWADSQGYMPHFNHYSMHAKTVPGGKPIWYRFDVTPEQVAKKAFLINSFNADGGPERDAVLVARSGGLYSSEARLRALGTHKPGMSWDSDQQHGSSGFVFLRQNLSGSSYHVWVSPRVTAQLGSYSFGSDKFGEVTSRKEYSHWDYGHHTQHSGGGNEMMVPDAISLLDDIEVLKAYSETQRQKIIKDLKGFGITEIRGLPVEDRIVTEYGVSTALDKARKALEKQAGTWFVPAAPVDWSVAELPADATAAEKAALKGQQAMDIESQAGLTAEKHQDAFGNEYVTLNVPVATSTANITSGTIHSKHLYSGPLVQWQVEPELYADISGSQGYTTASGTFSYSPPVQSGGLTNAQLKDIIAKLAIPASTTSDGDGDGLDHDPVCTTPGCTCPFHQGEKP
jgi:hypothetical protein